MGQIYETEVAEICNKMKKEDFSYNKNPTWAKSVKSQIKCFSNIADENLFTEEPKLMTLLKDIKKVVKKAESVYPDFDKDLIFNFTEVGRITTNLKVHSKFESSALVRVVNKYLYGDNAEGVTQDINLDMFTGKWEHTAMMIGLSKLVLKVIEGKAGDNYKKFQVKDLLRATISVTPETFVKKIELILDTMESLNWRVVEIKERLNYEDSPYDAVFIIFKYQGLLAELQVVPVIKLAWDDFKKREISHLLYEISRAKDTGGYFKLLHEGRYNYEWVTNPKILKFSDRFRIGSDHEFLEEYGGDWSRNLFQVQKENRKGLLILLLY